jgi:serine/threonine protein kinase
VERRRGRFNVRAGRDDLREQSSWTFGRHALSSRRMTTLPPGRANFRVVRPIGEGGLGIVDEIEITQSNGFHPVGTRLARKRLGPLWAAHPLARERFEREIAALCAMQHPNIITVQGENIPGGERFYCMPKCERSYRNVLEGAPNGFEWRSVATLGITLANALRYAHAMGFIHRDLKPENILLDAINNVYLADWGIGYFIHKDSKVLKLTQGGGLGTSYYCSIEQWSGAKPDPRMDVYALGMTLAELVQGRQISNFTIGLGVQIDVIPNPPTAGAMQFNALLRQMTMLLASARVASMDHVIMTLQQAIAAGGTPGWR